MGEGPEAGESAREKFDFQAQRRQYLLALEALDGCQGRRAAEWVACIRVAVEKRPAFAVFAQKGVEDLTGGQRGGHGQVSARDALAQAEYVRRDAFFLAGEHGAGAAEAGGDFIGDEQDVVRSAEVGNPLQIAFRMNQHPARALDERFNNEGGNAVRLSSQDIFDRTQTALVARLFAGTERTAIRMGRRRVQRREEERPVGLVEAIDIADAHGADGVAVIALREAEKAGFPRFRIRFLSPVLEGDFKGDFDGAGAGVRVEHAVQTRRRDLYELFGQPDRGYVGKTQ